MEFYTKETREQKAMDRIILLQHISSKDARSSHNKRQARVADEWCITSKMILIDYAAYVEEEDDDIIIKF